MELLIVLGALVTLDVLALRLGYDSRDRGLLERHDRALDAIRRGDAVGYHAELQGLEDELDRRTIL